MSQYLYRRKNSQFWYARFQYTGLAAEIYGKQKCFSLKTTDRREAEILIKDHEKAHKERLLKTYRQNRSVQLPIYHSPHYRPGEIHTLEDQIKAFADENFLHLQDERGNFTGNKRPNISKPEIFNIDFGKRPHIYAREVDRANDQKWKKENSESGKHEYNSVFDTWIKQKNISHHIAAEARATWEKFRQITNGKRLKDCTRDDGRSLVQALTQKGDKAATIQKKVGHLRAAVNLAIDDQRLSFNPFQKIVSKPKFVETRKGFTDGEMELVRANFHRLNFDDQILWKLLATTGMRRGEAFQIHEEDSQGGIRYVTIGTKSDTSLRNIPIPEQLINLLPNPIKDYLFTGSADAAGKRITRFLQELHIAYDPKTGTGDKRKVLHSLRHRAAAKLRGTRCGSDVRLAILGHDKKTVADFYGDGVPVDILKEYIDQIGF